MRIIIAVECKGDKPEIELSKVLNEITEKSSIAFFINYFYCLFNRMLYNFDNIII